jgi:hypothetical protein
VVIPLSRLKRAVHGAHYNTGRLEAAWDARAPRLCRMGIRSPTETLPYQIRGAVGSVIPDEGQPGLIFVSNWNIDSSLRGLDLNRVSS